VHFEIIPGWHLYWRNPGDSGEAPRIDWSLPAGWQAGAIQWPVPKRIPVGPLTNYGYEDQVTLLVPLEGDLTGAGPITARLDWLVCEVECIPESAVLALPASAWLEPTPPTPESPFRNARRALPTPLEAQVDYTVADGRVEISAEWPARALPEAGDVWFAADDWGRVMPAGAQNWRLEDGRLRISAPVGDLPPDGRTALSGLLVVERNGEPAALAAGYTFTAQPAPAPPPASAESPGLAGAPLGLMLLFAFAGGLILNLMPCVLPVLSIKVLGFARVADDSRGALAAHGALYTLGVVGSFAVLAGLLLALRAGGAALGWGFQLQSPLVITLLAGLMLLVGLNLSDIFQVGQRLVAAAGQAPTGRGVAAPVMHGVVAALVASPCTAPFMGTALGFAVVQPAGVALAIFIALGLGFAAPVLLLSLAPGWTHRLPRPGPWMDKLRHGLALPMYGTALWLVWVLAQQTSSTELGAALGALWLIGVAAWFWGERQRGAAKGYGLTAGVSLAVALVLVVPLVGTPTTDGQTTAAPDAWSADRVRELQARGQPVFVNFTAAWCITCKVNEQVALERDAVRELMQSRNIAYLEGDWTRRDAAIADELARHGRSGVPLYLAFPGEPGAPPRVLPQILTEDIVLEALAQL
jgi:thiol:disulfide interchange protein DsbD